MYAQTPIDERYSKIRRLIDAVQRLDVQAVKACVREGVDVNGKGIHGQTAMQQIVSIATNLVSTDEPAWLEGAIERANAILRVLIRSGARS